MPLVRIDLNKDAPAERVRIVSQAVHGAMIDLAGVRKEDVWINLVNSGREDWSFGNGNMQYAPKYAQGS